MPRRIPILAAVVLLLGTGCTRRPAQPPPPPAPQPPPPRQSLFVLLPEQGSTGRISVSNAAGSQELSQANSATRVESSGRAPSAPESIPEAEVRRIFGAVLDTEPAAQLSFLLYFAGTSDSTLTPESEALLPSILRAIADRRSTSISVTGHTDTTGESQANFQLGLRRANLFADRLRAQAVAPENLFVTSHGEADQLVKTPDSFPEPKNRRVEVIVR